MPLGKQITFQIVNMGKPLNKKVNSPQLQTHQMHVMYDGHSLLSFSTINRIF
jgi:hypothetical protein